MHKKNRLLLLWGSQIEAEADREQALESRRGTIQLQRLRPETNTGGLNSAADNSQILKYNSWKYSERGRFLQKGSRMDDMGDMEMDMESMMGGGDGVKTGDGSNLQVVTLSNIEQSCLALQQMGMILSEFWSYL